MEIRLARCHKLCEEKKDLSNENAESFEEDPNPADAKNTSGKKNRWVED